ncbi:hypothetical protein MASR2M78_22230 [Treponema sp.]
MTDVRILLARNMKKYRSLLGISQMVLAEKMGCSTTLIGNIEIAKRFPSADTINRLSIALNVHPSELFAEDAHNKVSAQALFEVRERLQLKIDEAIQDALSSYELEGDEG